MGPLQPAAVVPRALFVDVGAVALLLLLLLLLLKLLPFSVPLRCSLGGVAAAGPPLGWDMRGDPEEVEGGGGGGGGRSMR